MTADLFCLHKIHMNEFRHMADVRVKWLWIIRILLAFYSLLWTAQKKINSTYSYHNYHGSRGVILQIWNHSQVNENIIVESHKPSYAYLSTTRHLEKIRKTETFEIIGQWFQQHSSHPIYIAFWQTYKYQKLGTWHLLFNDRISIHWNRLIFGAVLKQSNLRVEVNAMLNRDYAVVCSAFFSSNRRDCLP